MEKASLILKNGDIKTCDLSGKLIEYEAMAVAGEKILAVGSTQDIEKYADPETEILDLHGKTVFPGLCDAHLHASSTREILGKYNLYATVEEEHTRAETIEIVQDTIRKFMETEDISRGIRLTGWNPVVFCNSAEGFPTAKDLDEACDEVPVVLRSVCQHYIWLNSCALEKAGIGKGFPDIKDGVVYRDDEGVPTGIFQEISAVNYIKEILPEADHTVEEYKESILQFQNMFALPMGITMICDALATPNAMEAYRELALSGELKVRVSGVYSFTPDRLDEILKTVIERKNSGVDTAGDMYHVPTAKFFEDGVEFMFYMREPFEADALKKAGYPSDYRGVPQWRPEKLKELFTALDREGFQIHVHAMGDGAARDTLDAIEYAREKNPGADHRHAIAHVMNISDADIERMAALHVIGSVQPCWGIFDSFEQGNISLMGEKRIEEGYPYGKLYRRGVRLASGTDFPIVPILNPYQGMQIGMTRQVPKTHPDYEEYHDCIRGGEECRVDFAGMLASYTVNGAYEMFYEDITGSLEAGKSADFVILPTAISEVDVYDYEFIRPESVYFKGKKVIG
ncbi:MAG: amidohydrolase [Clostridiales bacterium]|nr:amidohydrolase [Clostridiales bacterium]